MTSDREVSHWMLAAVVLLPLALASCGRHAGAPPRADSFETVASAELSWPDAYRAALGSRRWDAMVEVGDAALRIGEATGDREVAAARARRCYLEALFRARDQRSVDGVPRVAEAFAALGY